MRDPKELSKVLNEAMNGRLSNANEICVVILGTSFLDDALKTILEAYFADNEGSRSLIKQSLRSLQARTHCAQALGLISDTLAHNINQIRHIRNNYAHRVDRFTFDCEDVVNRCRQLKMLGQDEPDCPPGLAVDHTPINRFRIILGLTIAQIHSSAIGIQHRRSKEGW